MIVLLFLIVFRVRSEISLCFSRISPACFSILYVEKNYEGKYERKKNL